jgi:two-component system OmpR family sensor kinase
MTLITRLSFFFLVALAAVLVGFSATLYVLARSYLGREIDAREASVLSTLCAAADIDSEGVEWSPAKRRMNFDQEIGNADVRWMITDDKGRIVDRSWNLPADDALANELRRIAGAEQAVRSVTRNRGRWRLAQQQLGSPVGTTTIEQSHEDEKKFSAIHVVVAISLDQAAATLHKLLAGLCGLGCAFWLLAALFCRRMCRRALAPVRDMAAAAREMRGADLGQRLLNSGRCDELEELRKQFNGLLDRVQESFEKQKRFARDASHQLRTPLAAMLGQLEVALRRERPGEEYQRVLTLVEVQATRLKHIVETLLFLAQVEVEAPRPQMQRINFADWLSDHLTSWSSHSRAQDINVDCRLAHPLAVDAHPFLLGQLLDNLLDNACKYSKAGTPVTIRIRCETTKLLMSVEDAGCGISAADLPQVFEPFYRSANARRLGVGGTGLGLAFARQIAVLMSGRLTVNSALEKGSTFTLELPPAAIDSPAFGKKLRGAFHPART